MVRMIVNLMTLEQDIKNVHHYLDHLAGNLPGFVEEPAAVNLRDRVQIMEVRVQEALSQWPHLGMDAPL
jgi:hypothetical protein